MIVKESTTIRKNWGPTWRGMAEFVSFGTFIDGFTGEHNMLWAEIIFAHK